MQPIEIPQHPQDISPEWLTHVLRRFNMLTESSRVARVLLSDPGQEASYAGFVSRLTLHYEPAGTSLPHTMILKLPASERPIRELFRTLYRNEALFYRRIAGEAGIPVPTCYAALLNRRRTRSLLLLEDLSRFAIPGDHDTGCTIDQAEIALRRLAGFHATWWEHPSLREIDWLGHYRVNSLKNWAIYGGAWGPFNYRLRHITPPATLHLFRHLWRFRDSLKRLETGRPLSLQHGDYRLANLAFTRDDVYAFDWQVIRVGHPLFDVAWFMLTSLTVRQRRGAEASLLRAYHVSLIGSGVIGYTFEELINDYRLALLMTIPQIMVIGAFLRVNPARLVELGTLLQRFDAAREDHALDALARGS